MSETEICLKFKEATLENFNLILSKNQINLQFDFEQLSELYNKLLLKIGVVSDKKSLNYEITKKKFSKFLNNNYKLIKNNFNVDDQILLLFKDGSSKNWYQLHLSFVSYLSYLKQTITDTEINYKGMIDKLMIEIEEYSDTEVEEPNSQTLLSELTNKESTPKLMKGLIGDIKDILSNNDGLESKSIIDISKNLSQKYQNMIEKGDVNISDLLSGVLGIINDPESLNGEFDDIDVSKLPDPNSILKDMANDPNLKEAMNMMGNNENMGMFSSMVSNMMNNTQTDNKTIGELEKEIEQMMKEVQEVENNK